jgi:hypothetical protein
MSDDWRVHVSLAAEEHATALARSFEARELEHDVAQALGQHVAVSHDGADVFLYADSREAASAAEQVVRSELERHGWSADVAVSRWHDDAEDWEPADAPPALTAAEKEAEHVRAMRAEDAESAAEGADFEARAALPTRRDARELSDRLDREGVAHSRRWRYIFIAASDEDAARQWADRLRSEAPPGTEVSVEGTFGFVEQNMPTPFKNLASLGGGLP